MCLQLLKESKLVAMLCNYVFTIILVTFILITCPSFNYYNNINHIRRQLHLRVNMLRHNRTGAVTTH